VTSVLVTGAAGDIGAAIAARLASAGDDVVLTDHPDVATQLEQSAERCRGRGGEVRTLTFDVIDEQATDAAIQSLRQIDGLVNSAGRQGAFAPVDAYPLADARRVFDVNVLGLLAVLGAVSRQMIANGTRGSIVNIASMAGVSGAPNMPAYSASKAAVIGLTRAAAKDLARSGIRVNAVSPGFIGPGRMWENQVAQQAAADSPFYAADPAEVAAQMIGMVPLRRYGSTDEVARVVAFLLSDEASYMTGVNLEVAGGSV
jgi:NAD(P)-dependent dehydrogenase (short-subunit alcohol dehydrogenase family)